VRFFLETNAKPKGGQVNVGSLLADTRSIVRSTRRCVRGSTAELFGLNQRVDRLANALLNLGVIKGDKVRDDLPNCRSYLKAMAIIKIGAVIVTAQPIAGAPGLLNLLRDSDTSTVSQVLRRGELNSIKSNSRRFPPIGISQSMMPRVFKPTARCLKQPEAKSRQRSKLSTTIPFNIIYSSGTMGSKGSCNALHSGYVLHVSLLHSHASGECRYSCRLDRL